MIGSLHLQENPALRHRQNYESHRMLTQIPAENQRAQRRWWLILLAITALNCCIQSARFWAISRHKISLDGINYVGLARHIVDGDIKASVHGYWSPLTTWLIAVLGVFSQQFDLLGKLVTLGSFVVSLCLLYVLTLRLWGSRTAAAFAVFWFSSARGIIFVAAANVLADFVLTAAVVAYFILLLGALRENRPRQWVSLGAGHGLAFLAKAIAMPLLFISTILAVCARNWGTRRRLTASLLMAAFFPALIWAGWGFALKSKYGAFTSGYQLRANLLINWNRRVSGNAWEDGLQYVDVPLGYDKYMVGERAWAEIRAFPLRNPALVPMIIDSEAHNIPQALKETVILLSPSGIAAVILILMLLFGRRARYGPELAFVCITLVCTAALIAAYGMLVFDNRYLIPVIPLLIAIASPLLLPKSMSGNAPAAPKIAQRVLLGAFFLSSIFFSVYWASPLRTADRDFSRSCYVAAEALRNVKSGGTLVSIGNGPYPEHGVGFEAGYYVAYFAGWRLVGQNAALPVGQAAADDLLKLALSSRSDAIVVWGSPVLSQYAHIIESAGTEFSTRKLMDRYLGEVGTLLVRKVPHSPQFPS